MVSFVHRFGEILFSWCINEIVFYILFIYKQNIYFTCIETQLKIKTIYAHKVSLTKELCILYPQIEVPCKSTLACEALEEKG